MAQKRSKPRTERAATAKTKTTRDSGVVPQYLTAKEIAEPLKLNPNTILTYARRGLIPHVRIGRSVRFKEEDVKKWLASKQAPPKPKGKTQQTR